MQTSPETFAEWLQPLVDRWQGPPESQDRRSRAAFARAVGLDPGALSRILGSDEKPGIGKLPAICREVGCSPEEARVAYTLCGVDLAPVLGNEPTAAAG